ncbi:cryptochrome/photolyase family protein [Riemerella columbina]|uniref:cryptochrome/photolyase family protein n=1 Tax=Riemerella columbina TaxID=103810 RepID=UPI000375AEC4|nr:deoxyribodipyrimidine photo-lyase [Riemerella columbina]
MDTPISIFWFRRDLRWNDNHGLFQALDSGYKVLPIFIFDNAILDDLEDQHDRRVDFIYQALEHLNSQHPYIHYFYGKPLEIFKELTSQYKIASVFCNEDYEPYAIRRDTEVKDFLESKNIMFQSYKDQMIFAKDEILKADGNPYTVYTPYSKQWLNRLSETLIQQYPSEKHLDQLYKAEKPSHLTLDDIGFKSTELNYQPPKIPYQQLEDYDKKRNIPALDATSKQSVHLRFGTISPRTAVLEAKKINFTWLKELIWREFFMQILWHFPNVVSQPFRDKYAGFQWKNNEADFKTWCEGKTGFPLVDAGMRELNATGFMHNRVRMLVASFLVKDLQIDWRWGEAYFANKLLDFDLAQNNGNWQWAAGTGVDAAPYFRVFNPDLQLDKFDKNRAYVKRWIPEFGTKDYPEPMLKHKAARAEFLAKMKEIDKFRP